MENTEGFTSGMYFRKKKIQFSYPEFCCFIIAANTTTNMTENRAPYLISCFPQFAILILIFPM